jgi:cytochrome c peroxidase
MLRALGAIGLVLLVNVAARAADATSFWNADEIARLKGMSLSLLAPLRPDASNRFGDDPQAAALGKALFSDPRFSANGAVSCASCHLPDQQFQDGLPVGHGVADGTRRTMPIAGTAYLPFLFWDGRKDSQWSQALGPVENPVEHGSDRAMVTQLIVANYRAEFEAVFGLLPDLGGLPPHAAPEGAVEAVAAWRALSADRQRDINRVFANFGKAIAAFERTIGPPRTRFDDFADAMAAADEARANTILSEQERNGLKLYLAQNCATCHGGPLLNDGEFHNIGLPGQDPVDDSGRSTAVAVVKADPFNCAGEFSDADPAKCLRLKILRADDPKFVGGFRSPSLRGVAQRAPYMHDGQFVTLHDVLVHYNNAPKASFGQSEALALRMTDGQLADLEAFLRTLNAAE